MFCSSLLQLPINKKAVNVMSKFVFRHRVKENQLFKHYVILLIKRRAYLEASHQMTSTSSTSSSISQHLHAFVDFPLVEPM